MYTNNSFVAYFLSGQLITLNKFHNSILVIFSHWYEVKNTTSSCDICYEK